MGEVFPELIGVNPHYVENAVPGVNTNCVSCVNAAQQRLLGQNTDVVAAATRFGLLKAEVALLRRSAARLPPVPEELFLADMAHTSLSMVRPLFLKEQKLRFTLSTAVPLQMVLAGDAVETGQDVSGIFQRTFGPGSEVPNYTLHPPGSLTLQGSPFTVSADATLDSLLQPGMGNVCWAACTFNPYEAAGNLRFGLEGVLDKSTKQYIKLYGQ